MLTTRYPSHSFWLHTSEIILPLITCLLPLTSAAQIVPDGTLPVNSIVTPDGNTNIITGGTIAGGNLFHSFKEFSIPTGNAAFFNHALEVQNIFSRVTGSSISHINGSIRANGTANLFLLNPNGIIFGANARLNIGGSFLATTASSFNFADRAFFSATAPQNPLLTIDVPIGLQFGPNPAAIRVEGTGHSLSRSDSVFGEIIGAGSNLNGLRLQPENTLALIGGYINLEGGLLTAPGGRIELGSVGSGIVKLNFISNNWILDYSGITSFQDIELSRQAAVDASGVGGGSISLRGRRVSVRDGSVIVIQNSGMRPALDLNVNAAELLEIVGTAPDLSIRSTIANETIASGNGGNLSVSTERLIVRDGAAAYTATFSSAPAGNVILDASESIQGIGFSFSVPEFFSFISSMTFNSGSAGDILISTKRMSLDSGASILSSTFGIGNGGSIIVNASDTVEIIGLEPTALQPSTLNNISFNAGNANSIIINTSRLIIQDGGVISAGTLASGNAGSVTINASELVRLSGRSIEDEGGSLLDSSALTANSILRERFRIPLEPSGASGNITINTGHLTVTDEGLINVSNLGMRNAGELRINAESIWLNEGAIAAVTRSGEGGNIFLQADSLQMRQSFITTTAGGTGNGGNLILNTNTLVQLENSALAANAVEGKGGNIQIDTAGIFRSPDSEIVASSQFGVSGAVEVRTLESNIQNALITLESDFIVPDAVLANSCLTGSNPSNSFTVIGTGGLPDTPYEALSSRYTVTGVQELGNPEADGQVREKIPQVTEIVEAGGIVRTADGRTMLVSRAQMRPSVNAKDLICHISPAAIEENRYVE